MRLSRQPELLFKSSQSTPGEKAASVLRNRQQTAEYNDVSKGLKLGCRGADTRR